MFKIIFLGRSPAGRAIRCNIGFVASPNISTAIPNAHISVCEFQKNAVLYEIEHIVYAHNTGGIETFGISCPNKSAEIGFFP
jgi:hypothetical protein